MPIQNLFPTSPRTRGICLLLIASTLWSTGGLFIKYVDWNPLAIAGSRSAIAALVIGFAFRRTPVNWKSRPLLLGAVCYAATMLCFVAATKLTTAANAILLQYTSPVYVAILGAIFLKEPVSRRDWLTMSCVGGGMLLFFSDQMSPGNFYGNLLGILCGIVSAVMIVALRRQKSASPFGSILLGNIFTFLCGLPFMLDASPNLQGWLALALLGIFQLGISFILYSVAIKSVSALEASIITMLEPLLNPLWVFLCIGEQPSTGALLGGAIILTAVASRYLLPSLPAAQASRRKQA